MRSLKLDLLIHDVPLLPATRSDMGMAGFSPSKLANEA